MLENSPKTRRFNLDRLFPLITLALVVILIAGLVGVGGYLLLRQGTHQTPEVQAKGLTEQGESADWVPLPTAMPSPTPTPRPTSTPVVQATAAAETVSAATQETPMATPPLATLTPEAAEAAVQEAQVPHTGLGMLESAGVAGALLATLVGARAVRRRDLP